MKQVLQSYRDGRLSVADVPAPKVSAGQILVRNRNSLIRLDGAFGPVEDEEGALAEFAAWAANV